ncbi:MAG: hypothetical protein ACP5L1_07725 [Caldivirga sp.]|uniref:hypothetical protein n=1 Tax=Caldivirga sp. TaxID=2080243 RepID=UPI003D13C19C
MIELIYDIVSEIENELVIPIMSDAFKVISIIGGLALWLMVVSVLIKAIESKLGPTGWARAAALWDLFSNFKWFIVTIVGLYVTVYSLALIANYVSGSSIVNPASFAGELLYKVFFSPFIEIWKSIAP